MPRRALQAAARGRGSGTRATRRDDGGGSRQKRARHARLPLSRSRQRRLAARPTGAGTRKEGRGPPDERGAGRGPPRRIRARGTSLQRNAASQPRLNIYKRARGRGGATEGSETTRYGRRHRHRRPSENDGHDGTLPQFCAPADKNGAAFRPLPLSPAAFRTQGARGQRNSAGKRRVKRRAKPEPPKTPSDLCPSVGWVGGGYSLRACSPRSPPRAARARPRARGERASELATRRRGGDGTRRAQKATGESRWRRAPSHGDGERAGERRESHER